MNNQGEDVGQPRKGSRSSMIYDASANGSVPSVRSTEPSKPSALLVCPSSRATLATSHGRVLLEHRCRCVPVNRVETVLASGRLLFILLFFRVPLEQNSSLEEHQVNEARTCCRTRNTLDQTFTTRALTRANRSKLLRPQRIFHEETAEQRALLVVVVSSSFNRSFGDEREEFEQECPVALASVRERTEHELRPGARLQRQQPQVRTPGSGAAFVAEDRKPCARPRAA